MVPSRPPVLEIDDVVRPPGPRGCLGTAAGIAVLALISPFAFVVDRWRRWRRGSALRTSVEVERWPAAGPDREMCRVDALFDVPLGGESGFSRRITDVVVRVAESLRHPDDVYNLIYRLPTDDEALILPVGPQLQALGERFHLVLNQGTLAGRTVVWLTLGRHRALAGVVDSFVCDPEAEGEPDRLLTNPDARWAMASEWARVGPSLVIRLVLAVPADRAQIVRDLLAAVS